MVILYVCKKPLNGVVFGGFSVFLKKLTHENKKNILVVTFVLCFILLAAYFSIFSFCQHAIPTLKKLKELKFPNTQIEYSN